MWGFKFLKGHRHLGTEAQRAFGRDTGTSAQRLLGKSYMGEIKTFRDLIVWQKSMDLVTEIYTITK